MAVKEGAVRGRRCEVPACVQASVGTVILAPSSVHSRTLFIGQVTDCEGFFNSHKVMSIRQRPLV